VRSAVKSLLLGGLLGKLLGVAREFVFAALFGTGELAAAYRVAQTATLAPVNLFASDTLASGFLPLHTTLKTSDPALARGLYRATTITVAALTLIVATLLIVCRAQWVSLLGPGLNSSTRHMAESILVAISIGLPFYVGTAMASYVQMSYHVYRLASLRATVQSVGLIVGTVLAFALDWPALLGFGFSSAYIALWVISMPSMKRLTAGAPTPSRSTMRAGLGMFWRNSRAVVLLPVILQIGLVIERATATRLGTTATSALDYARTLTDTAVVLVAAPVSFAVLSQLAGLSRDAIWARARHLLRLGIVCSVPLAVFGMLHAKEITELLFARGAFTQESVQVTQVILVSLLAGLPAQLVAYVLLRVLNAQMRNATTLWLTVGSVCAGTAALLMTWSHVGPASLGIGSAVTGVVQLLGCCWALRLSSTLLVSLGVTLLPSLAIVAINQAPLGVPTLWAIEVLVLSMFAGTVKEIRREVENAMLAIARRRP